MRESREARDVAFNGMWTGKRLRTVDFRQERVPLVKSATDIILLLFCPTVALTHQERQIPLDKDPD